MKIKYTKGGWGVRRAQAGAGQQAGPAGPAEQQARPQAAAQAGTKLNPKASIFVPKRLDPRAAQFVPPGGLAEPPAAQVFQTIEDIVGYTIVNRTFEPINKFGVSKSGIANMLQQWKSKSGDGFTTPPKIVAGRTSSIDNSNDIFRRIVLDEVLNCIVNSLFEQFLPAHITIQQSGIYIQIPPTRSPGVHGITMVIHFPNRDHPSQRLHIKHFVGNAQIGQNYRVIIHNKKFMFSFIDYERKIPKFVFDLSMIVFDVLDKCIFPPLSGGKKSKQYNLKKLIVKDLKKLCKDKKIKKYSRLRKNDLIKLLQKNKK